MKQKSLLLIVALFAMQGMWAEHPIVQYSLDPQIVEHRNLNGLQGYLNGLVNINFDQLVFEYTSLAPDQKSTVRLTASINMPGAVYDKTSKARALVLYNQYTTCKKRERISQDNYDDASLLFNKFERFISISPDLYGWTLTEDKPQTYCCPEILAIETVDAWDAAMMLLEQEGYDFKDLPAFNVGYSSGGYHAMAVQKYVDEKRPDIFFTATSTGGAPYDFTTVLETYVKTNFTGYQCALPLVIVAYNETYNLGLDYKDIFLPPLCDKIDEWILSKDYTSWGINDLIGLDTKIDQMLTPAALDYTRGIGKKIYDIFRDKALCGPWAKWQPNTDTKHFILHSKDDLYIHYHTGWEMANYLEAHGCDVKTDFSNWDNHVTWGMVVWYVRTILFIENCIADGNASYFVDLLENNPNAIPDLFKKINRNPNINLNEEDVPAISLTTDKKADLNSDGEVNVTDVMLMIDQIMGKE